MTNNDVLRKLRFIFDLSDSQMIAVFAEADGEVSRAEVSDWLKKETDESYVKCKDRQLAIFLNGLINQMRGKRDGAQPEPENRLNNNLIFTKLKIALNLKADDVLELLDLADFRLSKHELSAFFRKKSHKNFRECEDQVLRNFLMGVQLSRRPESAADE